MAVFHNWRGSSRAALALSLGLAAFAAVMLDAGRLADRHAQGLASARTVAGAVQAPDLALFNQAPHARPLSQGDRHAPFQDHPLALEHFPAGSLAPPGSASRP